MFPFRRTTLGKQKVGASDDTPTDLNAKRARQVKRQPSDFNKYVSEIHILPKPFETPPMSYRELTKVRFFYRFNKELVLCYNIIIALFFSNVDYLDFHKLF